MSHLSHCFHRVEPSPGFGALLRALRDARGWSQDKLSDEIGAARNQVSDYERGRRWPNHGRVAYLDELLGAEGRLVEAASYPARLRAAELEIERLRRELFLERRRR